MNNNMNNNNMNNNNIIFNNNIDENHNMLLKIFPPYHIPKAKKKFVLGLSFIYFIT